eukprot:Selendium_serpulae@DN2836_c0_g1_i2.p1
MTAGVTHPSTKPLSRRRTKTRAARKNNNRIAKNYSGCTCAGPHASDENTGSTQSRKRTYRSVSDAAPDRGVKRSPKMPGSIKEVKKSKKVIVLDLDETLIHTSDARLNHNSFEINVEGSTFYVARRPGLHQFLEFCKANFRDVVMWTASRNHYADQVIKGIDPQNNYFSRRLYDTDCRNGGKYLAQLGIEPADVIFVDDQPGHFAINLDTGIGSALGGEEPCQPTFYANHYLISKFVDDPSDVGLYQAMHDLRELKDCKDVRQSFLKSHAFAIINFLTVQKGLNFERWLHLYEEDISSKFHI